MSVILSHHKLRNALMGIAVAAVWIGALGCKPSPQAAAAPRPKTAAVAASATNSAPIDSAEFVSTFEEYLPPDKAKDPFFPNSTRRAKAVPVVTPGTTTPVPPPPPTPTLLLKGIARSKSGPTAIINNAELQIGEEQAVRTSTGRVVVKVLEIGDDFVRVQLRGDSAPKTLMLEHKK